MRAVRHRAGDRARAEVAEAGDNPLTGRLGKCKQPRLASKLDSYEVVYTDAKQQVRVLPVLERLFASGRKGRKK